MIDLAKRGGQRRGSSDTFELYGEEGGQVVQDVPGDLATGRRRDPSDAGGRAGRRAYFCADTSASVADILTVMADRFSPEITFRACKQRIGAGQQQVRLL